MSTFLSGLRMVVVMTITTGLLYTLSMTLLANVVFYKQSTGSIMRVHGKPVGSLFIAQPHSDARYFHPRPSAAGYATVASGASNLGPASKILSDIVQQRRDTLAQLYGSASVPNDLVFASGSGLDPHISPEAALFQIQRIARARNFGKAQIQTLRALIEQHTDEPQFGILGMPRVNVLELNMALDALQQRTVAP